MRFGTHRWLLVSMFALAVLAGDTAAQTPATPLWSAQPAPSTQPSGPVTTGKPLMITRNVPGDAKPVVADADEICTWADGDQVVVMMRGQVLIQQGVLLLRCQEAVGWIDMQRYRATGVLHVDLYADGSVHIDVSSKIDEGPKALLNLNTRGELKLAAHQAPVNRQKRSDDPLYRRAIDEKTQVMGKPATNPIMPTSMSSPSTLPSAPIALPSLAPSPGIVVPPRTSGYFDPDSVPATSSAAPIDGAAGAGVIRVSAYQPPSERGVTPPDQTLPGPQTLGPPQPLLPPPPAIRPGPGSAAPPQPPAPAPPPKYTIRPRTSSGGDVKQFTVGSGDDQQDMVVYTGGLILTVTDPKTNGILDLEADRVVVFSKNLRGQKIIENQPPIEGTPPINGSPSPATGDDDEKGAFEFYLSGNVEIREQNGPAPTPNQKAVQVKTIRADEVYYDVKNKKAIALKGTLELRQAMVPDPIIFKADELFRTSETTYEVTRAEIFSSKLPSDPGLKIYVATAQIEDKPIKRFSLATLFGSPPIDRKTGQELQDRETYIKAQNVFFEVNDIPYFYLPYVAGDARDPLGPVQSLSFGFDKIFGFQAGATLDMFNLLGIQPYENLRWKTDLQYLSYRGPAIGTQIDYSGKEILDMPAKYTGIFSGFVIYDHGIDDLGGGRISDFDPPSTRGRVFNRVDVHDMPYGFTFQSQVYYLSDRNFYEQYFKPEFDTEVNANTYAYVKQQQNEWAWTGFVDQRIRPWVTETSWLPKVEGQLIGESFFNIFTYSASAREGYAQLRVSNDGPPYPSPGTDVNANTNRIDLMQEGSIPFTLGALKLVPYLKGDLASYSQDVYGDAEGRVWGGGGLRGSMPLTKLYPDVKSELFNIDGINHKMNFGFNYFYARSNEPYNKFPQLDRLNDDASDQLVRDILPQYQYLLPSEALQLNLSPLYNPQTVAIRRLLDTYIDTLDSIDVLQLDFEQRWQTKRGYPGAEHIVDVMTLDLQVSIFPEAKRDNFGSTVGMFEYDWLWNVGDRTALTASGLYDPMSGGPRIYNFGAYFNRQDRTNFFIGFTEIEPLQSRAVTASITYVFSPKYSLSFNTSYDFGQDPSQTNAVIVTRSGTDAQISFGLTYNSLQSNFGVVFAIVPNIVPPSKSTGPASLGGQNGLLR